MTAGRYGADAPWRDEEIELMAVCFLFAPLPNPSPAHVDNKPPI